MDRCIDKVVEFLTEKKQRFLWDEGDCKVEFTVMGDQASYGVFVRVICENLLVIRLAYMNVIPEEVRLGVSEFITRANSNLMFGNFDLCFEEGLVTFKSCTFLAESTLTKNQFEGLMAFSLEYLDRHLPALHRVVFEGYSPVQAHGHFVEQWNIELQRAIAINSEIEDLINDLGQHKSK